MFSIRCSTARPTHLERRVRSIQRKQQKAFKIFVRDVSTIMIREIEKTRDKITKD